MKKILLATTVLAMSAGFAAADVSVSGDGKMGVLNAYDSVEGKNVTTFVNNARIKFSLSGTTDAGLSFGGSFRAHEAATAESAGTSGSVFISGAFGKVTFGSVDSGDKASVGQLAYVGYTSLNSGNVITYVADGGKAGTGDTNVSGSARVLYTYSSGALTVNASSAQLLADATPSFGVGASYTTGPVTVALGYGTAESTIADLDYDYAGNNTLDDDVTLSMTDISASATYVMGSTTIKGIYQNKAIALEANTDAFSADLTATSMGASVSHVIDAMTLTAYSISTAMDLGDLSEDGPSVNRYGVGVTYDLGGGAKVNAGWAGYDVSTFTQASASDDYPTLETESRSTWDLGLNFSF